MEVDFSFILLLAKGAIVDLHVELRRADVEVEGHEEALMDVVVLCKLRPVALKVLLVVAIIPHLHLVWNATARLFTENRLSQFAAIHKLGKIQRQALNLTALCHGNAEEGKDSGRRSRSSRSSRRRSDWTWSSASHLGLVLATRWAAGTTLSRSIQRSSCGGRRGVLVLTSTRVTPTSWRHRGAKGQTRTFSVSHENKGETSENPRWREKMMRRRRNVIRVFYLNQRCFIYKHVLLGPRVTAKPVNVFYSKS
jgi:hypothetical protein